VAHVNYDASDKPIGQVLDEVLAFGNLGIYPEGGRFSYYTSGGSKRTEALVERTLLSPMAQ
jgi:hypothetical protein